jgi:hypothetical protein
MIVKSAARARAICGSASEREPEAEWEKEFIEAYSAGRSEVIVVDWWGSYYLPLNLYV